MRHILGYPIRPLCRLDDAIAIALQELPRHLPHAAFVVHHQHQFPAALREALVALTGRLGFRRLAGGQVNLELCAAPGLAMDLDEPAVALHNPQYRGQTQPRSLAQFLGGEKRIVDFVQMLRRNALPGIGHTQAHVTSRLGAGGHPGERFIEFLILQFEGERAAFRHGVAGVDTQIHQDLVQLGGVTAHQPGVPWRFAPGDDVLVEGFPDDA